MMNYDKFVTGQDVIKNGEGSVLAGFNRKVYGWTHLEAFQYPNEHHNSELHSGWNLAEKMVEKGQLFFVHNFHRHTCSDGHAFQYGGFWVCNTCEGSRLNRPWWTIKVMKDGNAWCCIGLDFENLQESDNYAFGDNREEAIWNYGALMIRSEQSPNKVEGNR